MLSSLAYSSLMLAMQSNALLGGVRTAEVNPAYTSVVGRVKYAKPIGISLHQAAALVLPDAVWDTEKLSLAVRLYRAVEATTSSSSWLQGIARSMSGQTGGPCAPSSKEPLQCGTGCASSQRWKSQLALPPPAVRPVWVR